MTTIAITWSSTTDTMLHSRNSVIKSCQEDTSYVCVCGGGENLKKVRLANVKITDRHRSPKPILMIPHESQVRILYQLRFGGFNLNLYLNKLCKESSLK